MSPLFGLLVTTLHTLPGALFEQALRPLTQVTAPAKIGSLSADACAPCHAKIYRQWEASRHRQAFTNRIFAVSFRGEPMRWCIYCHAPLPEQAAALGQTRVAWAPTPLVAEGVNCAVCHIRDGFILSKKVPSVAAQEAHPIRQEPQLAQAEFCGSCHQFNFPHDQPPLRYTSEPMQNTLAEWRRSAAAKEGQSCQHCHMAGGAHEFPGAHNTAYLRAALAARVQRAADGSIVVWLQSQGIGHNLPTGDPFRRLKLFLCSEPQCAEPRGTLLFGRIFDKVEGGSRLAADWTIAAPATGRGAERSLVVRELGPDAAYFRLTYSYAARATERYLAKEDVEIELASGPIEPVAKVQPLEPRPLEPRRVGFGGSQLNQKR